MKRSHKKDAAMHKKTLLSTTLASILCASSFSAMANLDDIPDTSVKSGKGFHGMIGAGALNVPEYVGGDDAETEAVPLINVDYNDTLYWKFNRGGWWFWKPGKGDIRVGLEVGMRQGWERDDLKSSLNFDISGPQYKEVENAILAGVNVAYHSGRFTAELSLLGSSADENFYDEEPGTEIVLRTSYTFIATKQFSLTASAKVEALSEDTVNYFYGINGYEGDSTTNFSVGALATYRFSKQWLALAGANFTSLGDEIKDSPIVADDSQTAALVGVAYTF
ncbi:MipA/OmpV family protein [Thalassotalea euphylliae]|uniref:MipA/OmpV family protein n=1 Tax=Thalassotalea euphylliae TaxID=1655234 RepID=UPI00362DF436